MSLLALLLTAVQAGGALDFKLALAAPKDRLVLGEPIKLNLTWTALRATEITASADQVRWFVDSGAGFQPYGETRLGSAFVVHVSETLGAGQVRKAAQVLAVSGDMSATGQRRFRLVFAAPGRYRVMAKHGSVSSNDVAIEVSVGRGRDAEVLSKLEGRLELLSAAWAFLENDNAEALRLLVEEYPTSPILARQRLLVWKWRAGRMYADGKREHGQPAPAGLHALLREIEEARDEATPFDEDRLLLLVETRRSLGLTKEAQEATAELLAKYPDGAAAAGLLRQKAEEDDAKVKGDEVMKGLERQLRKEGLAMPTPSPTPLPH